MFRKFYTADVSLLAEAFLWLLLARIATLTIPFRWVTRLLTLRPGDGAAQSPEVRGTDYITFARRARRALAIASRRTPWRSNCLS